MSGSNSSKCLRPRKDTIHQKGYNLTVVLRTYARNVSTTLVLHCYTMVRIY